MKKLICLDCGWIGYQEDCEKKLRFIKGGMDEELELLCPQCYSTNLHDYPKGENREERLVRV